MKVSRFKWIPEKGIGEYLTLLSICETCKYKGIRFLDFLRSGEQGHWFSLIGTAK